MKYYLIIKIMKYYLNKDVPPRMPEWERFKVRVKSTKDSTVIL